MAITRKNYNDLAVKAAHTVLLEISRILGEYRNDMVIVGGWVPSLILENAKEPHIGSMDVDIALNHRAIDEANYKTIRELLQQHGYKEGKQPFIFYRTVEIDATSINVEIDLLAGEYEGTGKGHRTQPVQEVRARKARGCVLAFEFQNEKIIEGTIPGGAKDRASVKVASIVPFLVMKGMALYDRMKEKDAYDIYYCVRNFQGGIEKLAEEFRPFLDNKLVKEGLGKIADKFLSPEHFGPVAVVDFNEITDAEERMIIQRDAFERVNALLQKLDFVPKLER